MEKIVMKLDSIPVYALLIFFIVYFAFVLFFLHKHFSKPSRIMVEANSKKIVEEFIANNDYPKISKSFEDLQINKNKLSKELNVNLKGYTLHE